MSLDINFYFPSIEKGGLEKNVFSLINSLADKKYKINFFTYENNITAKEFGNKFYFHKDINVITAKFFPGINSRYIKYFFCFFRLIAKLIYQKGVIVSFQGNILPIIAAKIMSRKIVIRCNTAPSKYINSSFKRFFFKFFYSFSDAILVTTEDFKKEIKKYFNLQSLVHRQSLDIKHIKKRSKIKNNLNFFKNFEGLKLINIGRLTYQKDQITLLKAFAKLIKFRKAKLLLIGSGEDEFKLKYFIQKEKLGKYIKIIPYVSNPYKYIMLSDIKVLSSRYEGSPNILLETACLKRLIVSSNCKVGPREILQSGTGGILFEVGNFNKLFLILKNISLNSSLNKNRIKKTYEYVKKNYQKDISTTFINKIKKLL
ncbi:glycosyltransferase [Candidatus Pelagibacter sp.]|nr:glycosyltransferase [Candidatus Pelagibacter sp.]